jgi:16S rRNA (adenine1518-N6/adenine1519-N6)-dimethyltransferase
MENLDYDSPSSLKNFLEKNGMAMQKKFGQNFMTNPAARKKIAENLEIRKGEKIFEIGPGLGCMTKEFLDSGAEVSAFEIDRGFVSALHEIFFQEEKESRLKIIEGDVLKLWKTEFDSAEKKPEKIAGNLPYNIAATFIARTVEANVIFDRCVFTVQKEVAERMTASPGSENYSAFSVLCGWKYDAKTGILLSGGNFWPRPKVASQAVILQKKNQADECDPKIFVRIVHALFSARRKTVFNNIKSLFPSAADAEIFLAECGIPKNERAENLAVKDFVKMTEKFSSR